MNHKNCLRSLLLLAAVTPFVSAVTLTTPGVIVKETFDTAPTLADWGTKFIDGGPSSLASHAALDSAVGSFSISGLLLLPTGTTLNANSLARYHTSGGRYVYTRPTYTAFTALVATVTNGTNQVMGSVSLTYDLIVTGVADNVPGHGVYYSTTGQAGSWTRISALSAKSTGSAQIATISGLSIPAGGKLYVLWADDNGSQSPDQALGIENVEWSCASTDATPPPAPPTAPTASATRRYRAIWNEDPATKITLGWEQVSGTAATVHYDTVDHGRDVTAYPNVWPVSRQVQWHGMQNCFARLNSLQPDTTYYFVLSDAAGVSERFSFRTAPNTVKPFTFISGGDTRSYQSVRQSGNKLVAKFRPLFVVFGGDMTNSSNDSEWKIWLDDWQLTTTSDKRLIPLSVTRGNHESKEGSLQGLFDCNEDVYYAYNVGGNMMRVYTLNSEITPGGDQAAWLDSDLAANSARVRHILASYHTCIRPHSASKTPDKELYNAWANVFYNRGVDLVIENDSHVMKRTKPIKPSVQTGSSDGFIAAPNDPNATVYVGEGTWGPLRQDLVTYPWTLEADSFNGFEYHQVTWDSIVMRTPYINSEPTTQETTEANPFALPVGVQWWNPASGVTLTIPGDGGQP